MAGSVTLEAIKKVYNQIAAKINDAVALCSGIFCPVCKMCPLCNFILPDVILGWICLAECFSIMFLHHLVAFMACLSDYGQNCHMLAYV